LILEQYVIEINSVTTPKLGYFTFWEKSNRRVDEASFPFKIKPGDPYFDFEHHMSDDDILFWQEFSSNIIPYNKSYTATSWENAMKYEIFKVIREGRMNRIIEKDGMKTEVIVNWIGNPVPVSDIQLSDENRNWGILERGK
jgi:hypothetical protein